MSSSLSGTYYFLLRFEADPLVTLAASRPVASFLGLTLRLSEKGFFSVDVSKSFPSQVLFSPYPVVFMM